MPKFHRPSAQLMALAFVLGLAIDASAQTVNLTFDTPVPGTIADANGAGSGFPVRLPGTGLSLPALDPQLYLANGELTITPADLTDLNGSLDLAHLEALGFAIGPVSSANFAATARYTSVPVVGGSNQLCIFAGSSATSVVRLATHSSFGNGFVAVTNNGNDSFLATPTYGSWNAGNDIELSISRANGMWTFAWHVLNSNLSGSFGPYSLSALDSAPNIVIGVYVGGNGNPVGHLDNFTLTAPCIYAPSNPLGPNGANTVTWPISQGGNGHSYEVVTANCGIPFTWLSANSAAVAAGGHLVTIADSVENAFVMSLLTPQISTTPSVSWLGALQTTNAPEPGSGWRWITGEPFAYTNWGFGQPNNNGNENRLQMIGSSAPGQWNDASDSTVVPLYVIEYEPSLSCAPPTGSAFTLCAAHNAVGDARLQVFNVPADTLFGKTLISTTPATPVGTGSFFGLNADLFTLIVLLQPYGVGDPLSWTTGEPGIFPDGPHLFPPGLMLQFAGSTWDLVAVALTSTGGVHFSNFVQNTW